MLVLSLLSLVYVAFGEDQTAVDIVRDKRQSYTFYYLCGSYPNQYISYTPCQSCPNCNPPTSCNYKCSSDALCRQYNSNWGCRNGCCSTMNYPPVTTTSRPSPVCAGREVSGGYCRSGSQCDAGFLCTGSNVCCRCAYGTSIGPCVNGNCPENTQCNANNECCPYQVGK